MSPNKQQLIQHLSGLRGIAIFMVLLFHCFNTFRNGYLGVDIFLVISGYLLFKSFWDNYETFECGKFILKKLQRLFPLAATISILCCVLALFLFPFDLVWKTAKFALSALIGCSNVYFDYTFSDYFSSSTRLNPLVHTWYLSLIAQTYLIYTGIALVCRGKSKTFKFFLIIALSVVSLVIYYTNIWLPSIAPLSYVPSTYYWTSGRLWMVCAGALAHYLPTARSGKFEGSAALLLLVAMGFSPIALQPIKIMTQEMLTVLCSCLVIVYGGTSLSRHVLTQPLVRTIGQYSFSLYIIHWPIIVFIFYITSAYTPTVPSSVKVAALIVSLLMTPPLYHLIEKRKFSLLACAVLSAIGVSITGLLILTQGLRDEIHTDVNSIRPLRYADTANCRVLSKGSLAATLPPFRQETHHGGFGDMQYWCESIPLLYGIGPAPENADFILLGDSHAEALYPGMDILAREKGWNGAYLHTYIVPLEDVYSEFRPYQRWDKKKAETLYKYLADNKQIKTVFLANYWHPRFNSYYIDWSGKKRSSSPEERNYNCLYTFLKRLRQCGKNVVVFADVPQIPEHSIAEHIRRQMLYKRPIDYSKLTCTREQYDKENGTINTLLTQWEKEGLCTVLHPETVLLKNGSFCCFQDGILYYKDGDHLSADGSKLSLKALEGELEKLLSPPKTE